MCVVSMVSDHYGDKWRDQLPKIIPLPYTPGSGYPPGTSGSTLSPSNILSVSKAEFEVLKLQFSKLEEKYNELKKDVEEAKALLIKAKEYDERNNEPHCEKDDKTKLVKFIADLVGVDLKGVLD